VHQWRCFLAMATGLGAAPACGDSLRPPALAPDHPGSPDAAPPLDAVTLTCDATWHDLQIGTARDDQLWGMTTDKHHNLYVSGFEDGVTGVTNIEPAGDSRGVVLQIDTSGAVRWQAVLDTSASDTIEDVKIDPETGTVYGVGRTSGAFEGFVNQGQFDTFVFSLDPTGQRTNLFQSGNERPQHPVRLSLDGSSIFVAGYDDVYVPFIAVVSDEDGFIGSFGRGGPELTQNFLHMVPTTASNRLFDVAADPDDSGSIYIASYVGGGLDSDVGAFVKRLNRDGTELWTRRVSASTSDAVTAVGISPAGELFVTGATFQQLGAARFGQQDAFVLKLDRATGAILWATQAGSRDSDFPVALAFDDAGNIDIAGQTEGAVAGINHGGVDVFAMKFGPDGTLLSSWQAGTAEHDLPTSIAVNCGRVLVGGFTRGALVEGSTGTTGDDMFIIQAAL